MTDATRRERANVDVLHTMDAQVWAQEFIRLFAFRKQDIDEGLMLSWFANAIMEGFDEANRRNATALADERRRVWEEAARIAMKKAQEPWKSEAANREGLRIAQAIRAKAHADQGGG